MAESLRDRWERFLVSFFGVGNQLDWPSDNEVVTRFVSANADNVNDDAPGPFVLPRATAEAGTTYYAIAMDDDQAHELRRVLSGVVGPTYTTYDGRTVEPDVGDQVLQAAVALAGSPERVFSFEVVGRGDVAKREVRAQILLLLDLTQRRPTRRVAIARPIGRLLRDFERALSDGNAETAQHLLFGPIAEAGRLSNINRLFLHVRLLAEFERWTELEALPSLDDLLRVDRPALVSDALARLAVVRLDDALSDETSPSALDVFADRVAPRFGALVPSVDRIRSAAGARYYALWQLHQGETPAVIRQRFADLSWGDLPELEALIPASAAVVDTAVVEPSVESVSEAVVAGRYEAALELLADVTPDPIFLPAMLRAVTQTMSIVGLETVARFREALGDDVVDDAVARLHEPSSSLASPLFEMPDGWAARIEQVATGELPAADALLAVEESGLLELVRDDRAIAAVTEAIENAGNPEPVLDVTLELLRRLHEVLPERERSRLRKLRLGMLRLWAFGDQSGDLTLANDVIDQVEHLFKAGCSTSEYEDVVELLSLRWEPFLSDVAFGVGVRALEVLAASRPESTSALGLFASPLVGRITRANVDRLDVADLMVADALCAELHLGLSLLDLRSQDEPSTTGLSEWRGLIGIYSLDENALDRAAGAVRRLIPEADVRTAHDKVATEPLRALAANADLMVVATQKAKHAATDAIGAARKERELTYPKGKGSSSLVRAVIDAVQSQLASA